MSCVFDSCPLTCSSLVIVSILPFASSVTHTDGLSLCILLLLTDESKTAMLIHVPSFEGTTPDIQDIVIPSPVFGSCTTTSSTQSLSQWLRKFTGLVFNPCDPTVVLFWSHWSLLCPLYPCFCSAIIIRHIAICAQESPSQCSRLLHITCPCCSLYPTGCDKEPIMNNTVPPLQTTAHIPQSNPGVKQDSLLISIHNEVAQA